MSVIETTNQDIKPIHIKPTHDKVIILESDMDDDMQMTAIEVATKDSHISSLSNQEIANRLKEAFEVKYYPTWICIVGKSFGCKINAQKKHYLSFQIDNRIVILYKYH